MIHVEFAYLCMTSCDDSSFRYPRVRQIFHKGSPIIVSYSPSIKSVLAFMISCAVWSLLLAARNENCFPGTITEIALILNKSAV